MKIEVDSDLKKLFNFDFEKNVKYIIKKIPKEHILGLDKIQLFYLSPNKHRRDAYGFYHGKREGEKFPRIIICVKNIFKDFPSFIIRFSFIPRMFLAKTIFHEVAHHYQRMRHGVSKHKWETDATHYTKLMMKRNFKYSVFLLQILFTPFLFIGTLLKKGNKGT